MRKGKRFPWGQVIGVGLSIAMGVGCGVVLTSWFDRCPAGVSRPLWALGLAAAFLLALLAQITLQDHALLLEFIRKRDGEGAEHAMAIHMRHAVEELGVEGL